MWNHPAVVRNVKQLTEDGVQWVGPEEGWLSCRKTGTGRMAEAETYFDRQRSLCFQTEQALMAKIVITSGPTRQYLDPVRYLTNASSGRMGAALAAAACNKVIKSRS